MRTLIKSKWIVAHDRRGHTLLRDGVLVFERERILHVGASFAGSVDHIIDAGDNLVCPGFSDTTRMPVLGVRATWSAIT